MATQSQAYRTAETPNLESAFAGTAWGPIVAGGVAATAISTILMLLGSGLGFSAVSPWAGDSMSASGLAVAAGIWLVIQAWVAAIFGGYMAGRLRTKWADHHSDEVYFRDSAHGFLAWALATMIAVAVSLFAGISAISGAASVAGMAASRADSGDVTAYATDALLRTPADAPAANEAAPATTGSVDGVRDESGRLLARAVLGTGTADDRTYLARLVSQHTGLAEADANARIDQVVTQAKEAADTARQASAYGAIVTALSLLVGAFIAAVAGIIGGRHRDEISETGRA